LGGVQQLGQHVQEFFLGERDRLVDVYPDAGQSLHQSPVGGAPLQHHRAQEGEQRLAGVFGFQQGATLVDHVVHPIGDHRLKERVFGREMPIDGARAHARPPRDLVDRHRQPLGREGLVGDIQHACPVAGRVGAYRPLGAGHCLPPSPQRLTKRGARSV